MEGTFLISKIELASIKISIETISYEKPFFTPKPSKGILDVESPIYLFKKIHEKTGCTDVK